MRTVPTQLRCESCEVTIPVPSEQRFQYTCADSPAGTVAAQSLVREPGDTRPIFDELVWCHACNAPAYIERIPAASEFEAVARVLRSGDDARFELDERREFEVDTRLLDFGRHWGLAVLGEYAGRLINRVSRRRCLACGSSAFTPITIVHDRVTTLRHEACGGELQARWRFLGAYVPSHMPFEPWTELFHGWDGEFKWAIRYLGWSPDGQVLWEQDVVERHP